MRIDSHIHFWQPAHGYDNRPVADHPAYRRDFLPGDVAAELDAAHVDGVILVQTCPQVEETEWLLDLAARESRILGVTGWVDLAAKPDFAALKQRPMVIGIRAQLRRIADDRFITQPRVLGNLAAALAAGLAVTILAEDRHHAHVPDVLEKLPPGPIIVNHLGLPFPAVDRHRWRGHMRRYAERPNVFLQFSGLPFLFGERWREPDPRSVLDDALNIFGPQRLLFASDWPMMVRFAQYGEWVRAVEDSLRTAGLVAAERDAIFGGNALRAHPRLGARVAPKRNPPPIPT